jgi:hypothetical protein
MKCDYCKLEFIEDPNVLEKYLLHLIINHGNLIN